MRPPFGAALAAGSAGELIAAAGVDAPALLARIDAERIGPLLWWHLRRSGELAACPDVLTTHLACAARRAAALEALRLRDLRRLHDAFAAHGVAPLLMKGGALAYTCYADPSLRPRDDHDLLVHPDELDAAVRALETAGYRRCDDASGTLMSYQLHYQRAEAGFLHLCDLHTRPLNPQAFADLLPWDEARAASVTVPSIAPGARALGPAHALLLACVHRTAHHDGVDELIWLYDIHQLIAGVPTEELLAMAGLAIERRVARVTAAALERAAAVLGTVVPADLFARLGRAGDEPSARYLAADLYPFDVMVDDLAHLGGWRARARLLKEHLFPPASYIRNGYAPGSRLPLPLLYVWRVARGAPRWLRRS